MLYYISIGLVRHGVYFTETDMTNTFKTLQHKLHLYALNQIPIVLSCQNMLNIQWRTHVYDSMQQLEYQGTF